MTSTVHECEASVNIMKPFAVNHTTVAVGPVNANHPVVDGVVEGNLKGSDGITNPTTEFGIERGEMKSPNSNGVYHDDMENGDGLDDEMIVKIVVAEIGSEKVLKFSKRERVWEVKQKTLATLSKELVESYNCGLFLPPLNGRAGKFLDDERTLAEYPLEKPIGILELKYKRRVYKLLQIDEKQLRQVNCKSNQKKLIEYILGGNVDKINKLCAKGLDPNFHCSDFPDTPLSLAATTYIGIHLSNNTSKQLSYTKHHHATLTQHQKSSIRSTLIALINGGAIVDYRTKESGATAVHRAVLRGCIIGLRTLLDLGANPNYLDNKQLTPLQLSCMVNNGPGPGGGGACIDLDISFELCEMLLHDHAKVGVKDVKGWEEVHHACRNGLIKHLECLLHYGADINAQNESGNTPLHVSAVEDQRACVRCLLYRGADKSILNFAGQTAEQVAVIAGNLVLAELIKNHEEHDIAPFSSNPRYNPLRRPSHPALNRANSCCTSSNFSSSASSSPRKQLIPPSPSHSNTAGSGTNESIEGGSINKDNIYFVDHARMNPTTIGVAPSPCPSDPPSSLTHGKGGGANGVVVDNGSTSNLCGRNNFSLKINDAMVDDDIVSRLDNIEHDEFEDDDKLDSASVLAAAVANANPMPQNFPGADPRITTIGSNGGDGGSLSSSGVGTASSNSGSTSADNSFEGEYGSSSKLPSGAAVRTDQKTTGNKNGDKIHRKYSQEVPFYVICIQAFSSTDSTLLSINEKDIITVVSTSSDDKMFEGYIQDKSGWFPSRCVKPLTINSSEFDVDSRNKSTSYGGFKCDSLTKRNLPNHLFDSNMWQDYQVVDCELNKVDRGFGFVLRGAKSGCYQFSSCPGLQYMDDVDPDGVADQAGVLRGDFLLKINDEDVRTMSHESVVSAIRNGGSHIKLQLARSVAFQQFLSSSTSMQYTADITSKPHHSILSPNFVSKNNPNPTTSPMIPPPTPPKRDPNTVLSIGRSKSKGMAAELAAFQKHDDEEEANTIKTVNNKHSQSPQRNQVYSRISEMKRAKANVKSSIRNFSFDPPPQSHFNDPQSHQERCSSPIDNILHHHHHHTTTQDDYFRQSTSVSSTTTTAQNHTTLSSDISDKLNSQRGYCTLPTAGRGRSKKHRNETSHHPSSSSSSNDSMSSVVAVVSPPPPRIQDLTSNVEIEYESVDQTTFVRRGLIDLEGNTSRATVMQGNNKKSNNLFSRMNCITADTTVVTSDSISNDDFDDIVVVNNLGSRRSMVDPMVRESRNHRIPRIPQHHHHQQSSSSGVKSSQSNDCLFSPSFEVGDHYDQEVERQYYDPHSSSVSRRRSSIEPMIPDPDYDSSLVRVVDVDRGPPPSYTQTTLKKKKSVSFALCDDDMADHENETANLAPTQTYSSRTTPITTNNCKQQNSILKSVNRMNFNASQFGCTTNTVDSTCLDGEENDDTEIHHMKLQRHKVQIVNKPESITITTTIPGSAAVAESVSSPRCPSLHNVNRSNSMKMSYTDHRQYNSSKGSGGKSPKMGLNSTYATRASDYYGGTMPGPSTTSSLQKSKSFCELKSRNSSIVKANNVSSSSIVEEDCHGRQFHRLTGSDPRHRNESNNTDEYYDDTVDHDVSDVGAAISENEIRRVRSQLKPSRSYPVDLGGEEGDNSSSGVSSDQEVHEGNPHSHNMRGASQITTNLKNVHHSRHNQKIISDTTSNNDLQTMKQMLHPKLQALFESSSSSTSSSMKSISEECTSSSTGQSRSISQSLSLIRRHVSNLEINDGPISKAHEVEGNNGGEGCSNNSSDDEAQNSKIAGGLMLKPPPGFSDCGMPLNSDSGEQIHQTNRSSSVKVGNMNTCQSYTSKPLMGWTIEDVCSWLDSLDLSRHKKAFVWHQIDGLRLTSLTKGELDRLGVVHLDEVMRIEESLKRQLTIV